MTSHGTTTSWDGLVGDLVRGPELSIPVKRKELVVLGIEEGEVALVARAIRADGVLGPAEHVVTSSSNELLVAPPDPEGIILELRAPETALVRVITPPQGPIDSNVEIVEMIRPWFPDGVELQEWISLDSDRAADWGRLVQGLGERTVDHARTLVDGADARFQERLQKLDTLDDATLADAVRSMVSVAPREAKVTSGSSSDRNAEFKACIKVLHDHGIKIPESISIDSRQGIDVVEQIVRQVRAQYREVLLDDHWWVESGGSLLARRAADGVPVALLPRRRGYEAFEFDENGEERHVGRVDEAYARTLDLHARMFYRPFPSGPIGLRDIMKEIVKGNGSDAITIILTILVTSGLGALVPILTGHVVGATIPMFERNQLLFIGLLLGGLAVAKAITHVVAGIAFLRAETRASVNVIAALVDRVLRLPAAFFRTTSAGDLTQRVMAVEQVRSALTQSTLSILMSVVAGLSNLGVLAYYDWKMSLTAIAVITVECLLVIGVSIRLARLDYKLSVTKGELDGFGIDMLMGIRQIRIQGSSKRVMAQMLEKLGKVGGYTYQSGLVGVWLGVIVQGFSTLALAFVFIEFVSAMSSDGAGPLGTGGFVAFTTALAAFLGAIATVGPAIQSIARIVPQYHWVRPLLESETEVKEGGGDSIRLAGGISTRGITFSYDPNLPMVLSGVDIEVNPGEFVAVVGRTGCGKSTLMRIMLGLEKPDSGSVLYDGVPLDSLDPGLVRSQLGVVMQSSEVITGNVMSTILGAGSQKTMDDAWAAARMVGMGDEIDRMPMGMLTMVSPTSMSQSQLQRLLIARALINRPEILFLDEATSALDNRTQASITKTIEGLGSTRFVIAHRLSTIRKADRIYVLQEGVVVQSGRFEELEAEGGHFMEIMAGQIS